MYFRFNILVLKNIIRVIIHLMFGCVRNIILTLNNFHFLTVKECSILNKRPLTLKESLKSNFRLEVPYVITPKKYMSETCLILI